jgi:phosphate transport system permease protein
MTVDSNAPAITTPNITAPLSLGRSLFSTGMTVISLLLTALVLIPLLSIVMDILRQGLPHLQWEALTALPAPVGMEGEPNGFANAILGTVTMVGLGAILSIPLGVLTAVYLSEFGKQTPLAQTVRFVIKILSAVPSIVVGVFAYGVIVVIWKFSALAGSFALAVIMFPIITLATEEAIKLVPIPQRLASSALGANALQTTFNVVIPTALPGITTGILLAVARAAGETAPLLFTALFSQNFPSGLLEPTASLPVLIYNYATSPFPEQNQLAWSASVILLAMVLAANILSRFITRKQSK